MAKAPPPPRRGTTLLAQEDLGAVGQFYLGDLAVRGSVMGIWNCAVSAATTPALPATLCAG
jgi:hypothetical protein